MGESQVAPGVLPGQSGCRGAGAGLVTEGGYVCSALLALGSSAREDDGAGQVSEQRGESELLPPRSQPQLGCPHPRQVRLLVPSAVLCRAVPSVGCAGHAPSLTCLTTPSSGMCQRKPSGGSDACQHPSAGPVPTTLSICLQSKTLIPCPCCLPWHPVLLSLCPTAVLCPRAPFNRALFPGSLPLCAPRSRCCGACREVLWGERRDFSVQSCCCSSSPRCCSATC